MVRNGIILNYDDLRYDRYSLDDENCLRSEEVDDDEVLEVGNIL